ncbi:MAG: hypothetical protein EKK41_25470 [Hyphomicrobiales bacterium]|nr:MAG: hypothetical protein EKK41_25470 [Hyphomicrobiales bacterium]
MSANDRDTKAPAKKPGEKEKGKYHYNPGNMSGKPAESGKDESEQHNNADRIAARKETPHSRDE